MALNDARARFENFTSELFRRQDFDVRREVSVGNSRIDLIIESDTTRAVVEVKLYGSRRVSSTILRSAAAQVTSYQSQLGPGFIAILVTNIAIDPSHRLLLEAAYKIAIYDFNVLAGLSSNYPDLRDELEVIVREADTFQSGPLPVASEVTPVPLEDIPVSSGPASAAVEPPQRGALICAELTALKPGRADAAKFEEKCFEALSYAFEDDFVGWNTQSTTNSGLHRFDLIARISSEESFWNSLIQDFRTRYVVFEFKNYAEEITQAAIYTTEKYLFPAAMRATAIIISRIGADNHANEAARGALRESGKLIINISLKQLCEILHLKDSANSPTDLLAGELDKMLYKIDR